MGLSSSVPGAPGAPWDPYLKSARDWWKTVPPSVRQRQAVAVGVGVLLAAGLGVWALIPRWAPLYSGLSPAAAGAMTGVLQQEKIVYRLAAGGGSILVPASEVDQARVDLAQHNLPASGTATLPTSSSLLSLGQTPAQTAAAEQAALEATLAETLTGIEGVAHAEVLVTAPPAALFGESSAPASASVFLDLNPGTTLSPSEVGAVQHLVASAVSGLSPSHVSVVNQAGTLLSSHTPRLAPAGLTQGQWQTVEALNAYYENRIATFLDQIFGPGSSVVRVSTAVNWDAVSSQTTKVTPNGLGAQQTSRSTGSNPTGSGAGTATNTPTYPTAATGGGTISSQSSISRYVTSTTKTSTSTVPGDLTHLTVAVAISRYLSTSQKSSVLALVRQAVGASPQDALTVVGLPFDTAAARAAQTAMTAAARTEQRLAYARDALFTLLAVALLVFIRRRLRPLSATETTAIAYDPDPSVLPASPSVHEPDWAKDPVSLAKVLAAMVEGGDFGGNEPIQ